MFADISQHVCVVLRLSCKVPWEATSTYQHFTLTLIFFHAWAEKAAVESYKVPSLTLWLPGCRKFFWSKAEERTSCVSHFFIPWRCCSRLLSLSSLSLLEKGAMKVFFEDERVPPPLQPKNRDEPQSPHFFHFWGNCSCNRRLITDRKRLDFFFLKNVPSIGVIAPSASHSPADKWSFIAPDTTG